MCLVSKLREGGIANNTDFIPRRYLVTDLKRTRKLVFLIKADFFDIDLGSHGIALGKSAPDLFLGARHHLSALFSVLVLLKLLKLTEDKLARGACAVEYLACALCLLNYFFLVLCYSGF